MASNSIREMFIRQGEATVAKGQLKASLKWFRMAGDHGRLGDIFLKMGDFDSAIASYAKGSLWRKAGEAAQAKEDYLLAEEYYLENGDYLLAAQSRQQTGDTEGALELLIKHNLPDEAAKLCEKLGKRNQAADIQLKAGNPDEALRIYKSMNNYQGMLEVYKAKGDLSSSIAELRLSGENHIAALICAADMRYSEAAEILAEMNLFEKAAELYQQAGEYLKAGELYEKIGKLDQAGKAYEQVPGAESKAAMIYESIALLNIESTSKFDGAVFATAAAPSDTGLILASENREILCVSPRLDIQWRFRPSGGHDIRAVAISPDGQRIVISSASSFNTEDAAMTLLSREKEVVLEAAMQQAPKAVAFLPDGQTMALANGSNVQCIDLEFASKWKTPLDFACWSLSIPVNGESIYAATLSGSVHVLNMAGEIQTTKKFPERVHLVRCAADGKSVLLGIGDRTVMLCSSDLEEMWSVQVGAGLRFLDYLPATNQIAALDAQGLWILNQNGAIALNEIFPTRPTAVAPSLSDAGLLIFFLDGTCAVASLENRKARAAEFYIKAGDTLKAAEIYRDLGEYQKACQLFREIGDFKSAAAIMHLTGDFRSAAQHYELIGDYVSAADLYQQNGDTYQAAKCYGKAGENIKAAELFSNTEHFLLAADFFERGESYKDAGDLFLKASQPQQAIANYEKYVAANPEGYPIQFSLGNLFIDAGNHDEAIRCLQKSAVSEDLRVQSLKKLGECFLAKGLPDIAIDRFNEALGDNTKVTQQNIDLFYLIGRAHEQAQRFDQAKEVFSKVLAVDYYYQDSQTRLAETQRMSALQLTEERTMARSSDRLSQRKTEIEEKSAERYQIVKKLGEGGMGVVYLAHDQQLDRKVAWKVLPSHLSSNAEYRNRFLREARAIAQLSNRHIVSIYDILSGAGECSIAMEYIEGTSLRAKIRELKQLSIQQAMRYLIQVCEALSTAHKAGIIHRDMKPENIMITDETDEVKVVDFGLARLMNEEGMTAEGCVMGTVHYMAPEQIRGASVDGRVDIYAMGVILFEMIAGRTPFTGDNVLAQHLQLAPPKFSELSVDVPEEIEELLQACLSKKKEDRPPDCTQIAAKVQSLSTRLAALMTT